MGKVLKLSWLNNTNSCYQFLAENVGLLSWAANACVPCCGGCGCVSHRSSSLLCWFFQLPLRCNWKSKWWEAMSKVSLRCACAVQNGRKTWAKLVMAGHQAQSLVRRTRWGWWAAFPGQDFYCQVRLRNISTCQVGWTFGCSEKPACTKQAWCCVHLLQGESRRGVHELRSTVQVPYSPVLSGSPALWESRRCRNAPSIFNRQNNSSY